MIEKKKASTFILALRRELLSGFIDKASDLIRGLRGHMNKRRMLLNMDIILLSKYLEESYETEKQDS